MTIKQQYQKARKNYLARVRNLENAGYQIERIPIPKKPTEASIRRLVNQTSKVLRQRNPLVNILTGEIEQPKGATERKKIEKRNIHNTKMARQIARELGKTKQQTMQFIKQTVPQSYDITIQNLYESIETFIPPVQEYIRERLDELLGDNSEERRRALAKTIAENPDYLPTPTDSNVGVIQYKFGELSRILKLNLEKEQELVSLLTDDIEQEE